jgi:hypothetical protein
MGEIASHRRFERLIDFLARIPATEVDDSPSRGIGAGGDNGVWWVKFSLDIGHDLAWQAVQEMAHVLNYLSVDERLPTVFKPVSPPPYLNGGPEDYLSWVIECSDEMSPDKVAEWLESRLPQPVEDEDAWREGSDEDDADADHDSDDEEDAEGWIEDDDET